MHCSDNQKFRFHSFGFEAETALIKKRLSMRIRIDPLDAYIRTCAPGKMQESTDHMNDHDRIRHAETKNQKNLDFLQRMQERDAERKASSHHNSENSAESATKFLDQFNQQCSQLQHCIATCNNASITTKDLSTELTNLEQTLASASYYLPSYDLRQATTQLATLKTRLQSVAQKTQPRKKFSFSSSSLSHQRKESSRLEKENPDDLLLATQQGHNEILTTQSNSLPKDLNAKVIDSVKNTVIIVTDSSVVDVSSKLNSFVLDRQQQPSSMTVDLTRVHMHHTANEGISPTWATTTTTKMLSEDYIGSGDGANTQRRSATSTNNHTTLGSTDSCTRDADIHLQNLDNCTVVVASSCSALFLHKLQRCTVVILPHARVHGAVHADGTSQSKIYRCTMYFVVIRV